MTQKKPISLEWRQKLEQGYLIDLSQRNALENLITEFPKDMEIPLELLSKTDDVNGKTFLHYAAMKGFFEQVINTSKALNLDLSEVARKTDNAGLNFLYNAIVNRNLNNVLALSKELNLDLRPALKDNYDEFKNFAVYYYTKKELQQIETTIEDIGKNVNIKKFKQSIIQYFFRRKI